MSREIKFRAWDKNGKIMAYSDDGNQSYAWFTNNDGCMICTVEKSCKDLDNIMLYTGLKDKNGKKIYEGDILLNKTEEFGDIYSKVIFADGCFMILEPECEYAVLTVAEVVNDVEVVGNIYENSELLGVGNE